MFNYLLKIMKRTFLIKLTIFALGHAIFFSSCSSVKQYQKNRINDSEMELSARKSQKFEQSFQLYREGGSGANGGKSGGGCGCN
jgi:hypothetical protein